MLTPICFISVITFWSFYLVSYLFVTMTTDDLSGRPRKRTIPLLFLLAINAGVGHILTDQVSGQISLKHLSLVKEEQVIVDSALPLEEGTETPLEAHEVEEENENESSVDTKNTITVYTVENGDTISGIAGKFGISVNTIRWANDLNSKDSIKVGDKLTILPITGVQYKVKNGDTISGIAKKYDADSKEILTFNGFDDAKGLKAGMEIIIPNGEPMVVSAPKTNTSTKTSSATTKEVKSDTKNTTTPTTTTASGYTLPIPGSILTQGIHGSNAVDFGAPVGTTVKAALSGEVILAKGNGAYNGGYGNYIVIKHSNGTQTLYAHLSQVQVSVGDSVSSGQTIGKSGNTGRSTGPHLHFEVRGATNPFGKNKVGTNF